MASALRGAMPFSSTPEGRMILAPFKVVNASNPTWLRYVRTALSGRAVAAMRSIPLSWHFFKTAHVYSDMDLSVRSKVLSKSVMIAFMGSA